MTNIQRLRASLREEFQRYSERPHHVKRCRAKALQLVFSLAREARRGKVDGWSRLAKVDEKHGKSRIEGAHLTKALREFLVAQQSNRCCYCRRWLVNTAYARPIDHILPKSHYKQFSLHFWNLAVACTDCNSLKTDNKWGGFDPSVKRHPLPQAFSDSFHPRFHVYDEHIRFVRIEANGIAVVLFKGLTPQGRQLCRDLLVRVAAQEMLVANNSALAAPLATMEAFNAGDDSAASERLKDFQRALGQSLVRTLQLPT